MDEQTMDQYCKTLMGEIALWGARMKDYLVDTVYFGGGTPTYLPPERLCSLLAAVRKHFSLAENAEITTECNPATVDKAALSMLRQAGFNRLSLGAQSMDDRELKALGRIHTASQFIETFSDARAAGFDNVSADLMFGIPHQSMASFSETLKELCALSPEHISAYGLKIEQGTPFYDRRDTLPLPDEDTEREMYMHAVDFLASMGYEQYEISNFAKHDRQSRHNLRYWRREDYLGMGVAAYSCLGDTRFSNTEDMESYLSGQRKSTCEQVSEHDMLCESVMLGMRLSEGCDFDALAAQFGEKAYEYRDGLLRFEPMGLLKKTAHGCAFTKEGFYVSNTILSEILDFEG
jgi:oxygen-independent coproporphyrinogen-3 oxidase